AFDYGFSKSLEEAKQKWPEEVIKCDVVRAIRLFRPLVVISRFSGTPSDNHGQHQYAGYISPIAVKAAADPQQCVDAGPVWQVQKFYREIGGTPTLRINTGQFDTLRGRSYGEIAIEGRSLHRSQGEGRIEPRGEQFSNLTYIEGTVPKGANETSIFDGIDTTITGIAKTYHTSNGPISDSTTQALAVAQRSAEQALKDFDFRDPSKSASVLAEGYDALERVIGPGFISGPPEAYEMREEKQKNESGIFFAAAHQKDFFFAEAIRKVVGLEIDALADVETAVPGEAFTTTIRVYCPSNPNVVISDISIPQRGRFKVSPLDEPVNPNASNASRRENANASARFKIEVPPDASPTQPYWLTEPRDGDVFRTTGGVVPFFPPILPAWVRLNINGKQVILEQPIQYRYADPSRGEIRREVNVVPMLSLGVDQELLIVPQSDKPQTRTLTLSITNNGTKPVSGVDALNIPVQPEWNYTKSSAAFNLKGKGEKTNVSFDVTIPAKTKPGIYHIYPNAMVGEGLFNQTMTTIAYPHIQTHRYYTRTETVVNVLDLKVAPVKVGYIMGSGD
ncbi:MAG TPA: NEW3 domain-containing protein, partial [Pyrinomonadaceae bacterium]|nr:NEW3 domain-containing protein [Pyrinomonadaceae bacterium]